MTLQALIAAVAGLVGVGMGLLGALPWRSTANAAEAECGVLREANKRLVAENAATSLENAELRGKTDLVVVVANQKKIIEAVIKMGEKVETVGASAVEALLTHTAQDKLMFGQLTTTLEAIARRANGK